VAKAFDLLSTPMTKVNRFLATEDDTLALGRALAPLLVPGMVLHLRGDLGAGKTTLARGILQGLGHQGRVKSPTYTLVEPYQFSRLYLYHFDFYRFESPQELDDAGLRECFGAHALCLVEWPEKAGAKLPAADLTLAMYVAGSGRRVEVSAAGVAGKTCLEAIRRSP
jgi:tRNA threonylcarbamoyladenosine biosynthesis protein TsaE